MCVPPGYLSKHNRKTSTDRGSSHSSNGGHLKKKKPEYETDGGHHRSNSKGSTKRGDLERIPEEDGEDRSRSNYSKSLREGGSICHFSQQQE